MRRWPAAFKKCLSAPGNMFTPATGITLFITSLATLVLSQPQPNTSSGIPQQSNPAYTSKNSGSVTPKANWAAPDGQIRFVKAFVVDDRLSPLRREPKTKAQVIQRLRIGRSVYILETRRAMGNEPAFCRVAATRRTRGWLHQSAVAVPGRPGEDARIIALIADLQDGTDRITLCRLLIDHFPRSPLLPRALLIIGEEADRAAASLTPRSHRRLDGAAGSRIRVSDLYMNDSGLDRYNKLHVNFDFNETTGQYTYDGRVYREIVNRFPRSQEAVQARSRLQRGGESPAQP